MILYTVMPPEVVLAEEERWEEEPWEEEMVLPHGARLLLRRDGQGRWVVSRLLSTEPNDFLDPRWRPGTGFRL